MFAVWLTGIPGSGKSTIAKEIVRLLKKKGKKVYHLQMDAVRKHITPKPKYTEEERDFAYRAFVVMASVLSQETNVVIDATAHKRKWRDMGRKFIKGMKEIYVYCPLDVAIKRESKRKNGITKNIYRKSRNVIGKDVKYERGKPFLMIDSSKINPKEAAKMILGRL